MAKTWNNLTTEEKLDVLWNELPDIRNAKATLEAQTNAAIARLDAKIAEQAEEIAFLKRLTNPTT